MKNIKCRKELIVGIKRRNIVMSDKIIQNKYVIIICKNK